MPQVLPCPSKSLTTDDKIKKDVFSLDLPPSSLLQQRPISPPSLCTPPRSPNFYHSHSNALSPIQPLSQQLALPFLSQQPSHKYISHTSDICKVDDAVGKGHETLVRRPETEPISFNNVPPRSPGPIESLSSSKRRWCPLHGHMYCPSISPACAIDGYSPCRSNTSEVANKLPGRLEPSSNLVQRSFEIWLYSPHHGWYGRGRIRLPLVTVTEIDSSFSPRPSRTLENSTTFYIHPDSILKAAIGVIKFRSLKKRKSLYGLGVVPLSESNGVGDLVRRYQWIPVALDANAVHFGIIVSDMPPARHRPHRQSRTTTTTPPSASSSPAKHSTKPPKPPVINPIDTTPISDPKKNHKTDSIPPIKSRISTAKPPLSLQSPPTPTSPLPAGKFQTPESPGRIILVIFCTLAVSSYLIAFVADQFADITVPFGGTQSGSSLTERKSSLLEFGSTSRSRQIPFQLTSLVHHKPTPVISAFSPLHRDSGRTQDDLLPVISETPCTTDTSVSAALWTVAIVASVLLVLLVAVIATGFLYRRSSPNEKTRWQRRVSMEISGKKLLQRPVWYLKRLRRGSVVNLARTGSDAARDLKEISGSSTMISGTTENYGCSSPTDPPVLPVPGPLSKERYVDTPSSRPGVKVTTTDCKTPPIPIITTTADDHDTTILYPTSEQPLDANDWEFALIHAARPRSWDGERTRLCTRR